MIPEELEKLIIRHKKEGHLPFFVNCTTGTTVYGAFDPIEPIADICEKYGIWLHIDVSVILKPFSIKDREIGLPINQIFFANVNSNVKFF